MHIIAKSVTLEDIMIKLNHIEDLWWPTTEVQSTDRCERLATDWNHKAKFKNRSPWAGYEETALAVGEH